MNSNKKGMNVIGLTMIVLFGAFLIIFFDGITTSISAGATVKKSDDAATINCKYTLHSLIGGEYSRIATDIGDLPDDPIYAQLVEYYSLPILFKNEWQKRIEAIRSIPEFSKAGDLFICYEQNCLISGWTKKYLEVKAQEGERERSISCSSRVYGPYRNDEVVLYLIRE